MIALATASPRRRGNLPAPSTSFVGRVTVEPLALPNPESTDGTASPAAQLFLDRARAARPRFELTPDAAEIVGEITRHIDGLPLAIELAQPLLVVERRLGLLRDRPVTDAGAPRAGRRGDRAPRARCRIRARPRHVRHRAGGRATARDR